MTTGLDYTKRRRQLTGPRTGWTVIRRRTVGGKTMNRMRTSSVFDTLAPASETEVAHLATNTYVKRRQVQAVIIWYIYYVSFYCV